MLSRHRVWRKASSCLTYRALHRGQVPPRPRYSSSWTTPTTVKGLTSATGGDTGSLFAYSTETTQQVAEEAAYQTVLDGTGFTSFWASVINDTHVILGVPYWEAILIVTAAIRAVNIPLFFRSVGSAARMRRIMPHLNNLMKRFSEARQEGDEGKAMTLYRQRAQLMKEHNVGLFRSFVPLVVQAPMALGMIWALRELSIDSVHIEQFRDGGTLWFQHLDVPDPLYALPAFTALTGVLSAVLNPNTQGIPTLGLTGDKMRKFGIGFAAFFGLVSTQFPAGTQVYFAATSLSMCVQQGLLRSKFFKKMAGIPIEFPNVDPLPLEGQTQEEAKAMQKQYEAEQTEKMKQNPFVKTLTEALGTDQEKADSGKDDQKYVSWKGIQNTSPPPPPPTESAKDHEKPTPSQSTTSSSPYLTKAELDAQKKKKQGKKK